jgi:hypothetical protein
MLPNVLQRCTKAMLAAPPLLAQVRPRPRIRAVNRTKRNKQSSQRARRLARSSRRRCSRSSSRRRCYWQRASKLRAPPGALGAMSGDEAAASIRFQPWPIRIIQDRGQKTAEFKKSADLFVRPQRMGDHVDDPITPSAVDSGLARCDISPIAPRNPAIRARGP